jgi:Fe2+ transport system protein FeoA
VNKEDEIYKVKFVKNNRLREMGLIKGTIFRIVKKVFGMIQIKLKGSDIIIREETMDDIKYDK